MMVRLFPVGLLAISQRINCSTHRLDDERNLFDTRCRFERCSRSSQLPV